ncbi:MAG: electron transport complex subunit E [Gammaproteobacteria bacterium]
MSDKRLGGIVADGLWHNNQALVAILGLCPLLAVSATAVNGLGLGLATALTLVITNTAISGIRRWVRPEIRIPVFVLIIASVVTVIELAMKAWLPNLYRVLGIFVPLIVTNCTIIGRAEAFASRNTIPRAALDGLSMGLGFTAVLLVLGMMRELIGYGTLFRQAGVMFGHYAAQLSVTVLHDYRGVLLAVLPPGAFMALAVLIATKNAIDRRLARRRTAVMPVRLPVSADTPPSPG